jgi:hypothetical protein
MYGVYAATWHQQLKQLQLAQLSTTPSQQNACLTERARMLDP